MNMAMIAEENFEVNYENAEKSIALQNKTGTAHSKQSVVQATEIYRSFTRRRDRNALFRPEPGKIRAR